MRIPTFCALVFVCLLFATSRQGNAQTADNRNALRGLSGIGVWLKAEPNDLKELDLSVDQLGNDVELRLRKAGIPVFEAEAARSAKGAPRLVLAVSILILEDKSVVFNTNAHLLQWVHLQRQGSADPLYLPTWSASGTIGIATKSDIRETVRQAVSDTVDRFINDYLAANPKPSR